MNRIKNIFKNCFIISGGILLLMFTCVPFLTENKSVQQNYTLYQCFSTENNYDTDFSVHGISDKYYFDLTFSNIIDSLKMMESYEHFSKSKIRNIHLQLRGALHILNENERKFLDLSKTIGLLNPVYLMNTSMVAKNSNSFFENLMEQTAFRFFGKHLSYANNFFSAETISIEQYIELKKISRKNNLRMNPKYVNAVFKVKNNQNFIFTKIISFILCILFWISFIVTVVLWIKKMIIK